MNENSELSRQIIKRLEAIGEIKVKITEVVNHEIFDELSKHDEWWHSIHSEESDKLDEIRRTFIELQTQLWNIQDIIDRED